MKKDNMKKIKNITDETVDEYFYIKRVDYEEDTDLIEVIENLIYLKEDVLCNAYTDFHGIIYDNRNLEELKRLRDKLTNSNSDKGKEEKRYLLNCVMAHKNANESIQYWVYQTKESLDSSLSDDFEYQCYYYISIDENNYYTVKYACYFLYNLQTKDIGNAKELLDQIMLNVDNRFDYSIFKDLTLNYTNYVGFLSDIYDKYFSPIDADQELEKIKRLIDKN